jgi:uncharacterized protein YjbJ (UPF0337 family)
MSIPPRHFPTALASLILLVAPLGCHPDAEGDVAATRSAPIGRHAAVAPRSYPGPAPGEEGGQGRPGEPVREFREDVRQAVEVVEDGVGDVKGEVTQAVGAAQGGVRHAVDQARGSVEGLAGEARGGASQASDKVQGGLRQAVDQVVGGVQEEVEGAKDDVRQRARSIQADVKQSAQGLKKHVLDGIFGPSQD